MVLKKNNNKKLYLANVINLITMMFFSLLMTHVKCNNYVIIN